jgi:DNA-binding transcriptional regulator YiaG
MSVPMKARPTSVKQHYNAVMYLTSGQKVYAIPKNIAEQYIVANKKSKKNDDSVAAEIVFAKLEQKLTKGGALLKGLRARENLSQTIFATKIGTTQANLSNMENGRRPMGKMIAKRIEKIFNVDYRYFVE